MQLEPKPLFEQRMKNLLDNEEDYSSFIACSRNPSISSIRVNTLKISVPELKARLEKKGWKMAQPFKDFPEAMIVESDLMPGELGNSIEHLLGYFYVQEISSMMPIYVLKPSKEDVFIDLCASPGSKTTQAAMYMENSGTIIANDNNIERIKILSANLERCGVSNVIVTKESGEVLCKKLNGMIVDKILCDVPCSGEGTLRSSPKTFLMWNLKVVEKLSRLQKKIAASALEFLRVGGEMIYSTCTHSPEENEEVLEFLKENFDIKIEKIELPLKTRPGLSEWKNKIFNPEIKNAVRIYPHDNDTEGFFLAKIRKMGERK